MDVAVLHIDDFDPELFEELRSALQAEQIDAEFKARPNSAMAVLEWMVIPAVAFYIAKPFIDKFLAKAAEDAVAAGYPKLQSALQSLVVRLFKHERNRFKTVSSAKSKVVDEGSWLFGIYSVTRNNTRTKFVFGDGLTEDEYQRAVTYMFDLLRQHHLDGVGDEITLGISRLLNPNANEIYLLYDREYQSWRVMDPVAEIKRTQSGHKVP